MAADSPGAIRRVLDKARAALMAWSAFAPAPDAEAAAVRAVRNLRTFRFHYAVIQWALLLASLAPRHRASMIFLIAASAVAAGDSGALLLAAHRGLPAVAAWGHRIRLLHSFSGGRLPRRPEVACGFMSAPVARPASPVAVRSRNVHSAEVYKKAYEERVRQLIERLKKERINPKQWRLGTFQRMLYPMCERVF